MPTPLSADLPYEDLRAGWQKVANRGYGAIHVYRLADGRHIAVTNKAHASGAGEFVETIAATADEDRSAQVDPGAHGLGAYPGRTYHQGSTGQ